jgi:sulfonate transport system substrate-binding protein
LPLFALVTAPKAASTITTIKQLEGKTVAVSALANADHALTLYLLKQAGADASIGSTNGGATHASNSATPRGP